MEIGVDCVDIPRFSEKLLSDKKFIERVYSPDEIAYCSNYRYPAQHYAVRFAGKEAVIKALSSRGIQLSLNQVEILNALDGRPYVRLWDTKGAEITDITLRISMSHADTVAIAFVIAE
jgi:holo-[acyl-carrier protein] synthase